MSLTRRQCLLMLGTAADSLAAAPLAAKWREIAAATDGVVGAAALLLGTGPDAGQTISLNGDARFPLASVCKLPIAMNIFAMVDEDKLTPDQPIEVLPRDVVSSVSPLAARWPAQRKFPLGEMVEEMVAHSDNTAVETFFRIGGEGPGMAARFRQWKVAGIRLDRSERQCGLDRNGVEHYPPT